MYAKAAIGCFLCLTIVTFVVADVSHLAGGNTSPGFRRSSVGNVPVVNNLRARSFNQQNWNIRNNIPGEPGVDYPIYSVPPVSSFSCKGRHYGGGANLAQVLELLEFEELTADVS
ncbi:hypothetical protein Bhyg_09143 [Pseudolycoriella hygida]|uniref:Uncharacterized protein n=1 Tax=Pseudolycoriella hygida TaxID=35572 RepID=A0A9Q0N5X3_9DIPT|nr:hypothetical protein Bhyg_09143 [Pseudolycoriella hygida]